MHHVHLKRGDSAENEPLTVRRQDTGMIFPTGARVRIANSRHTGPWVITGQSSRGMIHARREDSEGGSITVAVKDVALWHTQPDEVELKISQKRLADLETVLKEQERSLKAEQAGHDRLTRDIANTKARIADLEEKMQSTEEDLEGLEKTLRGDTYRLTERQAGADLEERKKYKERLDQYRRRTQRAEDTLEATQRAFMAGDYETCERILSTWKVEHTARTIERAWRAGDTLRKAGLDLKGGYSARALERILAWRLEEDFPLCWETIYPDPDDYEAWGNLRRAVYALAAVKMHLMRKALPSGGITEALSVIEAWEKQEAEFAVNYPEEQYPDEEEPEEQYPDEEEMPKLPRGYYWKVGPAFGNYPGFTEVAIMRKRAWWSKKILERTRQTDTLNHKELAEWAGRILDYWKAETNKPDFWGTYK